MLLVSYMLVDENFAPSTFAGIITAVATVITALGGLILAFAVIIPILRRTKAVEDKIDGVHKIVNQQQTDLRNYIRALQRSIKDQGGSIPIDQSITPSPDEESL